MITKILFLFFLVSSSPALSSVIFWDNVLSQEDAALAEISTVSLGPVLDAQSAIVIDAETGKVLLDKSKQSILPIASITKLMTALVFLNNNEKNWNDLILIKPQDLNLDTESPYTSDLKAYIESDLEPSGLKISQGDKITVQDIFYGTMIKSANNASNVLARISSIPCCGKTFIDLMNEKAQDIGMLNTHFVDSTGLNHKNYSTTQDLAKLILEISKNQDITSALEKKFHRINIIDSSKNKKTQAIYNTNILLNSFIDNIYGKTGYLDEGGYCFAGTGEYLGQKVIVVILGAATSESRFEQVKSLIYWGANQLNKKKLIQ